MVRNHLEGCPIWVTHNTTKVDHISPQLKVFIGVEQVGPEILVLLQDHSSSGNNYIVCNGRAILSRFFHPSANHGKVFKKQIKGKVRGVLLDWWMITLLGIEDVVVPRPVEQVQGGGLALRKVMVNRRVPLPPVQVHNSDSYASSSSKS